MLTRRLFSLAAPSLILTPGLVMPVKPWKKPEVLTFSFKLSDSAGYITDAQIARMAEDFRRTHPELANYWARVMTTEKLHVS